MLDPSDQAILDRRVRLLVDADVIAEHRADPLGSVARHSPQLLEILHFLRRNPDPARPRYFVVKAGTPPRWRIAARGATTNAPLPWIDDAVFDSREAAEHAVFLRRLADYGLAT